MWRGLWESPPTYELEVTLKVTSGRKMRNPDRISTIIAKLIKLWGRLPDWRLCQLISNLHGGGPQDIFYTEDDELEKLINKMLKETDVGK